MKHLPLFALFLFAVCVHAQSTVPRVHGEETRAKSISGKSPKPLIASGIRGAMILMGTPPLNPADHPDALQNFQRSAYSKIGIFRASDCKFLRQVQTDKMGLFGVRLPPGSYILVASAGNGPQQKGINVTVQPKQFVWAEVVYDCGW